MNANEVLQDTRDSFVKCFVVPTCSLVN